MLKLYENKGIEASVAPPLHKTQDLPFDQILIEGLVLDTYIGIFEHELEISQPVRFDIIIDVLPLAVDAEYDPENIVRYDLIVADIKAIVASGHVDLVETLAEDVAKVCLSYERAHQVEVKIGKPAAFAEAEAVGIKITRRRPE